MVTFIGFSRLRMSSSVKSSAYAGAAGVAEKKMLPVAAADVTIVPTAITNNRGLSFLAVNIFRYQKMRMLYKI
jgi:hypothetical protein